MFRRITQTLSSAIIIVLWLSVDGAAQSLIGITGLVTIPTAQMSQDKEIQLGLNWADYMLPNIDPDNQYRKIAIYVTIGYLPFLEISPRITRMLDYPESQAIGDRMVSVKLRLFGESSLFPSIVLGANDFLAVFGGFGISNNFNSLYMSASKTFQFQSLINNIELHAGYGVDWVNARQRQFIGLFGGVLLSPMPGIAFMLEHDSDKFNCGMRISIFKRLEFLVALLGFDNLSGGLSYKFRL